MHDGSQRIIAKLPGAIAEGLIATVQFFGRIAVSVHNALNRVIASRAGKNLQLVTKIVIGMRTASR
jgi:hypothetical protein